LEHTKKIKEIKKSLKNRYLFMCKEDNSIALSKKLKKYPSLLNFIPKTP